jgi:hypothetical protein
MGPPDRFLIACRELAHLIVLRRDLRPIFSELGVIGGAEIIAVNSIGYID